jgi:LCP family protein required for cell wall assembly
MTEAAPQPRLRRTWPQRFLLLAGLAVSVACFGAAQIFWEARTVLADLPRIRVGPDVLAQSGAPGDPVNFLLVGVDSSEGLDPDDPVRSGRDVVSEANGRFLSDTILMLRLDPATGDASVMSIPRDLYVDVPGSSQWRINSTLLIGGMDKLIETIDANLSVPVNHFVMVDFAGFSSLVELVDGVPVYFPYATRDLGSGLQVPERGCWILDGPASLAYVRARSIEEQIDGEWVRLQAPAPDLARIERQQEFMVLALEQALELGGSDLGRIREFVEVGTQAVQLDEELTPGQLLDLATAFSDYDTEALRVATLPVAPLFSDDGRYLGEQLQPIEADDILQVFQGAADGVRPPDVTMTVTGTEGGTVDRAGDQLVERGFEASVIASSGEVSQTTIRFPRDRVEEAVLVGRYLEGRARFLADEDVDGVALAIGPDFAGVREFPAAVSTVEPAALDAARVPVPGRAVGDTTTTAAPTATTEPADTTTTTVATETTSTTSSTIGTTTTDVSDGPTTTVVPTTTIVRGRPPVDVRCTPLGG